VSVTTEVVVETDAASDGFLLLADTFYPGWTAEIDGKPARVFRAHLSVRAIQLPRGAHVVRFVYEPPRVRPGLAISAAALALLFFWLGAALYGAKRSRDRLVEAD